MRAIQLPKVFAKQYSVQRQVVRDPRGLSWCRGTVLRWYPVAFLRVLVGGGVSQHEPFVDTSPAENWLFLKSREKWSDLDHNCPLWLGFHWTPLSRKVIE